MNTLVRFIFLAGFFISFESDGQNLSLSSWPARLQLYARDPSTSRCGVPVSGRITDPTAATVSVVTLRDQKPYAYTRLIADSAGLFRVTPSIKAEPHQYSFQLFQHRSAGDSVRIATRDSIVCGDAYLIMGQSNAVGRFDNNPFRSTFCRSFGVNNGNAAYNPADTSWCLTNTAEGVNSLWGVELQRYIYQRDSIPTAVINGAVGSTDISTHLIRIGTQPDNLNTLYGRLLYRTRKAGLADQPLVMIWRQGEAEAANNSDGYAQQYARLYGNWRQDYPNIRRVYMAQLNILPDQSSARAGAIRDFQRQITSVYANHVPIATVGLPGYQGLHYDESGYRQFGLELYRLIARDLYKSTDTSNIASPNLKRLFYSKPDYTEITMEFEAGQRVKWPADSVIINPKTGRTYTQRMTDFIYTNYPNGESGLIQSVSEQGNKLVLTLARPVTAQTLTYLPSSYQDNQLGYYAGPTIRNERGMRALTFQSVPIAAPLPVANDLRAVPLDTAAIQLNWNQPATGVDHWEVERADTSGQFRQIASLSNQLSTYSDRRKANTLDSLRIGELYRYRIRAIGQKAEASYSPVVTASLQFVLGIPIGPELTPNPGGAHGSALVYPNPAADQVFVRLPLDWSGDPIALILTDSQGKVVLQQSRAVIGGMSVVPFSVATLPVGIYVLKLAYRGGGIQCRLVVNR
ncbi:putative secreted protein (Por secretion system target) [Spirosoma oryzae]|uniref:Putative secreted protein (Por secretion system target) n=1 Tax=Spirosoma oryzae TaxID=1469603 RepID=A0A2T0S6R4_9BACT|nr:sialate O-acetylesterase [Spirosoma oryzae]PRY29121.1 putative secreted protein (Por secretion system target) [Spirosoma oryzae]